MSTLAALFEQADREARQRARTLEHQGRLPQRFTETHYPLTDSEIRDLRRLRAYMTVADTWDTYLALANGQPVPRHRIRPEYRSLI